MLGVTEEEPVPPTHWDSRFFARTRGRVMTLRDDHTMVEDLAQALNLSDNGDSHHGPCVGVRRSAHP